MKVRVIEKLCVGCGECAEACPEIFKIEGDEAMAITNEVPEDLKNKCREAADVCSVQAIEIEE